MNKPIFVAAVVSLNLATATAMGGCVLYTSLYLSAFVALVPDDPEDSVTFWDTHATKNMMTVFVCLEMLVSRGWAGYECFRVLRTEALGSAIEQRKWALTTMWLAVGLTVLLDAATHVYLYTKDESCAEALEREVRTQRTFAALCAQSDQNQFLVGMLHHANLALVLLASSLLTVDSLQQMRQEKAEQKKE